MDINLKELRVEKGLTQREVAFYCGVSITGYINWESGTSKPTGERLEKMIELFGELW